MQVQPTISGFSSGLERDRAPDATIGFEKSNMKLDSELQSTGTRHEFSIGICATGRAENLKGLLDVIGGEHLPEQFALDKIVIVASECTTKALEIAKDSACKDRRIELLEEPERKGKAEAINKIIENAKGEFLVFVNSDALPAYGSIRMLLETIQKDANIGMVSGCPIFDSRNGATSNVLRLMWSVHNQCSLVLNHKQMSNHCSDEMMIVRRKALERLPHGIVNDGAYIAGTAALRGFSIKFCERALVYIDVPPRFVDIIGQRRRIIFGHIQVKKLTGKAPRTFESLLLFAPILSLSIAVRILGKFPKLVKVLPVAVVGEAISFLLAVSDSIRSTNRHGVWKRYAD